jgi:hypothetical protein
MGRGPSYPFTGLEESIALARKMYDYTKKAPASMYSVISNAWKYSESSSSGHKVLAALRAFGLVEDVQGGAEKSIRLTPRAIRILLDDNDSKERQEELRKAALSPNWYSRCWKQWGKDMPPSMRSSLLINDGFVDTTVDGFLRDYRKTMAFVGLLDDEAGDLGDESSNTAENSSMPGSVQSNLQEGLLKPKALPAGPEGALAHRQPALRQGGPHMSVESFHLSDGISVSIEWPQVISPDSFEDFGEWLELIKKRVRRAVRAPGATNESLGDSNASEG